MRTVLVLFMTSLLAFADTPWVTSVSPSPRADGPYTAGGLFQMGATSYYLTSIGRLCLTGDSGNHTLYIVNAADSILLTATVNMAGCQANTYVYTTACLHLTARTSYYILSTETGGAEPWSDGTSGTVTTSAATLNIGAFSTSVPYSGGPISSSNGYAMFVGLNFTYARGCGGSGAVLNGLPVVY